MALVAPDGFRDVPPYGKHTPAAKVEGSGDRVPQGHQDLSGGEAAPVSRADVAPLGSNDGGVVQQCVQREGKRVAENYSFPGGLPRRQHEAKGLVSGNLPEGGGSSLGDSADEVLARPRDLSPDVDSVVFLEPANCTDRGVNSVAHDPPPTAAGGLGRNTAPVGPPVGDSCKAVIITHSCNHGRR